MGQGKVRALSAWILKGFFVFTLLFPAFYSPFTDVYQSAYYGGFSWAYLCLVLYMGLQLLERRGFKKKLTGVWYLYFGLLAVYNLLSFYFNYKELHWYWEQINNTIAFLFFAVLILCESRLDEGKQDNIRFLIVCIVLSNLGSLICYALGYTKFLICNNQFVLFELPSNFYEMRHYWIYSHKSEYALMLVAFTALFVACRDKFRSRLTFAFSMGVLLGCLYLTHSWTGVAGVFLIFAGAILDGMNWKEFHLKKSYLAGGAVLLVAAGAVGYKITAERDIWTLGHRTNIWGVVVEVIRKYPQGWGMRFGESAIEVAEGWYVNNAHNVFLNALLRFSIPVGVCFTILFFLLVIYSVVKSRSFLAAGMWLALLILLDMDYSLMSLQMGLLLLIVYLVCIYKRRNKYVGENTKELCTAV